MIIPLGERYRQAFYLFEKKDGKNSKTRLLPTLFVPMTGQAESERKTLPDSAHPRIFNPGFEAEKDGAPDGWFYLRQAMLVHRGAPEGNNYLLFTNSEPGRDAHALQGIGLDGHRVRSVHVSLWIRGDDIRPGNESYERAGFAIRFLDSQNRMLGQEYLGPWQGTFRWKHAGKDLPVPRETQSAMIQVGLRGATGRLSVDDVVMTPRPR